ncbi:MAG: response regulator transcription factor [Bacteroidales bacterium]|nr:response regulator transcription factor [Bacteroidales bacterium]
MIKVMIADDHPLMIDGIRNTLEDSHEVEIVAEASNGYEVLKHLDAGIKVDVILMDINMPKLDGLDCTRKVTRQYPEIKVIGLSQYDEKRFVKRMIKNGATGYLLKDSSRDDLIEAILSVAKGENYFSSRLSASLVSQELKLEKNSSLFPKLTLREIEVLNLICQEYSSQEIAEKLFISFHTVESHRANLMHKSGTKNTAGLVKWAVENDFVD